jgi:hypothetical protein
LPNGILTLLIVVGDARRGNLAPIEWPGGRLPRSGSDAPRTPRSAVSSARPGVELAAPGGKCMTRERTMVVSLAVGLALLGAPVASASVAAQDAGADASPADAAPATVLAFQAQIAAGDCVSLGATIAELADVTPTGGEAAGAASAVNPATSLTTVPLTLDALEASAASIFVSANGQRVACGAIGGVRAADDVLVITLQPVGDAGISGLAFLSSDASDPSQTDVSLFLDAG